ncbi:LppA family lipoprotein [Mycobacteroides abscessus subsp. bolletii]|uniref:LppA family lipoprotein n=1 Tax=Mycobacteroides abscessus TaxID=36809 RepID=UPI0019CFD3F9|nr:LppA family lipoprotein [Mycobacteroides abscessus]MBN7300469.1 LppA family lipoprotein [Mycobacteroides abscessus subsp. bolletii]
MDNRYAPTPPTEAAKALEELKTLPSLEDTKTRLEEAVATLKTSIGGVVPSITWTEYDKGAKANCSKPYDQSDGQSLYLPDAVADRITVSESQWEAILQATKEVAATLGATNAQVMQDKPGKHDVWFTGPAGLFIKISHSVSLVIASYTGCRLPAAKR